MTKLGALATLALGLFVVGCNEEAEDVELRSLQASTEMTFVCRDRYGHGVPRSECPDFDTVPPDPPRTRLFSLVTQTATDEVAVVDLLTAQVYDVDKSMPGFSFLRMPSRPGDIVTTPGGAASFVGLTGVGKTGIAAIPSSCIDPPFYDQTGRDVTTFPACSLPSKPADMVVLVEPPASDGIHESCDPNSPIEVQQTLLLPESPFAVPTLESVPSGAIESIAVCDGVEVLWTGPKWCGDYNDPEYDRDPLLVDPLTVTRCPQPDAPETKNFDESQRPGLAPEECYRVRDCGANLTAEGGPRGRRKLVVALPDEGRIVVIDAQRLLDRPQGSFGE
ncbi:MAG TPA: hypothetical protein VGK73_28750, partial [Polyangiaceae bacterium]